MAQFPGQNNGAFNAEDVDPAGTFEPLPAGQYSALIEDSEVKATKKGDGSYLSLKFKIINNDDGYENRNVWCNLNLDNPNPKAVEIAQRELSAICHAVGVLHPEDSSELHGIPLTIRVKVREATSQYPASNDVSGFSAADEGDAPW